MIALLWIATPAQAVNVDVTFCLTVAVDYPALVDGDIGDVDLADVEMPARGFYYVLDRDPLVFGGVVTGYLGLTGGNAGCATRTLVQGDTYGLTVVSEAEINTNLVHAWDVLDPLTKAKATATGQFVAAAGTYTYGPLPGDLDNRWNHLAVVSAALKHQDGGLTNQVFNVYSEEPCPDGSGGQCAREPDQAIYLNSTSRKLIATHELGHLVSHYVDEGGDGANVSGTRPDYHSCDGNVNDNTGLGKGWLVREFNALAAKESMASFYGLQTWNVLTPGGGEDCESTNHGSMDWNLDGEFDADPNEPWACFGDPWDPDVSETTPADPDGFDWLADLVAQEDDTDDGEECDGILTGHSTDYDWVRFFWGLVSVEGVDLPTVWALWDGADPHDWNATYDEFDPYSDDSPEWRLYDAAIIEGVATEVLDAGMDHGLYH